MNTAMRFGFSQNINSVVPLTMVVDTTISGGTGLNQFDFPVGSGTAENKVIYNGQIIQDLSSTTIITFPDGGGLKTFDVLGVITNWRGLNTTDPLKILNISELGQNFIKDTNYLFDSFSNCKEIIGSHPLYQPYSGNVINDISSCNSLEKLHLEWPNFELTQYRRFFRYGNPSSLKYLYINYRERIGTTPSFSDFLPSKTSFSERFELRGLNFDLDYDILSLYAHLDTDSIPIDSMDLFYKQWDEGGKTGKTANMGSNTYSNVGQSHKNNLISKGWSFVDGGLQP